MLTELVVRDFALVEHVSVPFKPGMTVMTGASGAGKSILLGALGLVLGERAAADTVRPGATRAEVSALFQLADRADAIEFLEQHALADPDEPDVCVVRRVVNQDGRSRAFINGSPVTVAALRAFAGGLVDICGQHESVRLANADTQLALLDDYAAPADLRAKVARAHGEWQRAARQAAEMDAEFERQSDRAALIDYQLTELSAAQIGDGEFTEIESKHRRLAQADSLRQLSLSVIELLDQNPLARPAAQLAAAGDDHPALAEANELLAQSLALLDDAAHALNRYSDTLDISESAVAELAARLDELHALARKHRTQPEALPDLIRELGAELERRHTDRSQIDELVATATAAENEYRSAATKLSKLRHKHAPRFAEAVSASMRALGIDEGSLDVVFDPAEHEHGLERVAFHVKTSDKYAPAPLAKIASGGEQSRINLAVQIAAAEKSRLPCLVLDEADVGVGGTTADVLGRLMRQLSAHTQVICVTHAPQVAALGVHHLRVARDRNRSVSIDALSKSGRIEELARMLAGADITAKTRSYAKALLGDAEAV